MARLLHLDVSLLTSSREPPIFCPSVRENLSTHFCTFAGIAPRLPSSQPLYFRVNIVVNTGSIYFQCLTIEYLLIKDFNDSVEVAKELAFFLKDIKSNVNLIPYNSVGESEFKKPSTNSIMKFKYILEHSGKKVTIRLERGADIDAACGQLSGKTKA